MPLLDIALQLSRNKTRAPSKYSKTFKIFQNLGNLWSKPTSSRDSKTRKNTRQHCRVNICSYIGWIDKLSSQPIVTNIEPALLSKNHFLSAMSQFTSDKYHLFCCCAAGWVGGVDWGRAGKGDIGKMKQPWSTKGRDPITRAGSTD